MSDEVDIALRDVSTIFFDVDGTLTDGQLFFDNSGKEHKAFFARDGSRMTLARRAGIKIYFITGRMSESVRVRAVDRGAEVLSKKEVLENGGLVSFFKEKNIDKTKVLYVGDDINDLPFMRACSLTAAVADAAPEVKEVASFTTILPGGKGAAAEVIERILKAKGMWKQLIA